MSCTLEWQCSYPPGNRYPFRRCGICSFFVARGLGTSVPWGDPTRVFESVGLDKLVDVVKVMFSQFEIFLDCISYM